MIRTFILLSAACLLRTPCEAQTLVSARVRGIVQNSDGYVTSKMIGASRSGRPVHVMTISDPDTDADAKPALMILAGAQGHHLVGIETALNVAETLVLDQKELLATHTVYVVPCMNPDTAEGIFNGDIRREEERDGLFVAGWTLTQDDSDRDGRIDEDGPVDLNGDGMITMMRVDVSARPAGGRFREMEGLDATLMISPDDDRLMIEPDAAEGQVATHALFVEGRDQDGDGRIAEDGPGGVNLDMNFTWHWPEHKGGAGRYPLSEPGPRLIVDWMLAHNNIVAVLVFGPHDTLVNIPKAGKNDRSGSGPIGIENADAPYYKKISKAFKDITRIDGAASVDDDGSFHRWAYAEFGVMTFSTPVWVRPDLMKKDDEGGEDAEEEGDGANDAAETEEAAAEEPETVQVGEFVVVMTPEGVQEMMTQVEAMSEAEQQAIGQEFMTMDPGVRQQVMLLSQGGGLGASDEAEGETEDGVERKKSDSDGGKWLTYSDEQRSGSGFIEWTAFEHPELGPVEIGGWVPGFRVNPPEEELPELGARQSEFAADLLSKLPRLTCMEPTVELISGDVWRVTLTLRNDGYLPSRSAIGTRARRLPPITARLGIDRDAILVGSPVQRVGQVDGSGGQHTLEWIVRHAGDKDYPLVVRSPVFGEWEFVVRLR